MKILEPPRTNGHTTLSSVAEQIQPKPKRRRPSRRITAIVAAVLAVVLVAAAAIGLRPKPAAAYVTEPVSQGTLTQSVTATGTVNPQNTINIGSQVSGLISEVDVDFNSRVKKGQVLAKIDPTTLQAQLNSAQASLAQSESQAAAGAAGAQAAGAGVTAAQMNAAAAQAAVASAQSQIAKAQAASGLAQQTVSRDRQLLSQGYIAQSQLDTDQSNAVAAQAALSAAVIGVKQAQAQLAAQNATAAASAASAQGSGDSAAASSEAIGIQRSQVAQAQYNLNHTVITSPVDGTVIARDVALGETVAASLQTPTLFAIAQDLTKMEVDVQVGEPDIGSVKAGDTVSFTVLAFPTRTFAGTVSQVRQNPTTVSNVVTYTTVVRVDNKDGALRPGMTANATIATSKMDNATIVPVAALQWRPPANAQVVGPDGKPFQRRTPGQSSGSPRATAGSGAQNAQPPSAQGGSPWGSSQTATSSTVVAGTRARLYVADAGKLRMVPVQVQMVSGASAAVQPLRGTLGANDAVVIAGGTPRTGNRSQGNRSSSPFAASPGGGARIPRGG